MFTRALLALAVVASAAAAPNGARPTACGNVPAIKVSDAAVFAKGKVCSALPGGLKAAVTGVAYEVPSMYGCRGPTTVWCDGNTIVDKKQNKCKSNYLYCCGQNCSGIPKKRYCEYKGVKYEVGVAYDLGSMTMWCVDEKKVVTCQGKQCGSCIELTPPGHGKPCKPPTPQPQCRADRDCRKVNGVAFECRNNKCVPAEGPKPDNNAVCRADRDCPKVNGVAFECRNNKCVPAEGPKPDNAVCRADRDCPKVNGVAFECRNNKCVPAEGPKPDDNAVCRADRDCPNVNGVAHECRNNKCVPAYGPVPTCRVNSDCRCPFGLACVCKSGQCVPSDAGVN